MALAEKVVDGQTQGRHPAMTKLPIAILATAILMAPIAAVYGQQAVVKDKIVGNFAEALRHALLFA
jgi:hypothetical protein